MERVGSKNCDLAFERHSYLDSKLLMWKLPTHWTCVSLVEHEALFAIVAAAILVVFLNPKTDTYI